MWISTMWYTELPGWCMMDVEWIPVGGQFQDRLAVSCDTMSQDTSQVYSDCIKPPTAQLTSSVVVPVIAVPVVVLDSRVTTSDSASSV